MVITLARVVNYAPRVINYAPKVMLQIAVSPTIVIYDFNMLIVSEMIFQYLDRTSQQTS